MPHCLDKDDEYNGYFIPGQSVVLCNAWQVLSPGLIVDPHQLSSPQGYASR